MCLVGQQPEEEGGVCLAGAADPRVHACLTQEGEAVGEVAVEGVG